MKYLVYMSTPTALYNHAELKQLLQKSQAKNLEHDITGMLLYETSGFVQALEGEDGKVDELYEEIQKDTRHKSLIKLIEGSLKTRIFPHWSMGFKSCSKQEFSKLDAFIKPRKSIIWTSEKRHPMITLLRTFAETNYL